MKKLIFPCLIASFFVLNGCEEPQSNLEKQALIVQNIFNDIGYGDVDIQKAITTAGDSIVGLTFYLLEFDSIPAALGQLTSLKRLDLSSGSHTYVPPEFCALSNLEQLNLSGNDLRYLPECFGNLTNLKVLLLDVNKLDTLPESMSKLVNLEKITLHDNQLRKLPEGIGNWGKLTRLNVSNNKLVSLPSSIGALAVVSLNLTNNLISTLPESIDSQLEYLSSLSYGINRLCYQKPDVLRWLKRFDPELINYRTRQECD